MGKVKRENVNYFMVGLVVLAAVALLMYALFAITGRSGPTDSYTVRYRNVAGLGYGTAVFYQGYRIGQVERVTPKQANGDTEFEVEFSVARGWQIPKDSIAQQLASGLLSDVFIGIQEGQDTGLLEPGSEIAGREGGDLFAAVGALAGEVTELTRGKVSPLVDKLGRSLDGISAQLETQGPRLVDQAADLVEQLLEASNRLNQVLDARNRQNLAQTLEGASGTAQNLKQLSDELRGTREQLDRVLVDAGAMVSDARPEVDQALGDLRITLGALAQRIDAITHNLDSASRNFDEFARQIRREPNRLLFSPPPDELKDRK